MNTGNMPTPIQKLDELSGNELYIKRDDLFPYCFGGNKARKAMLFFEDIKKGEHDCVVTYGSGSSNHVRIISNLCAANGMDCYVIAPQEAFEVTYNSKLREMFGAEVTVVPTDRVHDTIEDTLAKLRADGRKPYFIPGGGHGNIGTEAYVRCYEEIKDYEVKTGVFFDYIFFASGTGTTHAGLVCGQIKNNDDRVIIGISIARPNPRGRNVVLDSIREYMGECPEAEDATIFEDKYIGEGYGKETSLEIIKDVMTRYGIPLDLTYTGKAFYGMSEYLKEHDIKGKNVLFIHTGGTPLFFDAIDKILYGEHNS